MNKEHEFILDVKKQLDKTDWNFERKDIIEKAVEKLRDKGYSNSEIRKIFEIEIIKEQDNSQMVTNNSRYLDLLDEILNS
ncbi:MAG: hypothetical protein H2058_17195 [Muricauda sp.]|nr:hypothetical protein [Allomuricauda sp.]MBA4746979.1 hypothetical protein [Allomuricauda sp.]